jgi:polar amino acid transport system substrate-binding protein
MLSRRAFTPTLASLFAGLGGSAWAGPPVWVSGEVPPYLSRGAQGPEGYAFELFQRVTRQADVPADLQFYPWARALRMLEAREAHAALVITRTPEREAQFRWLFPVGSFRLAVVTRAADGPMSSDITALIHRRVGTMRASVSRSMLAAAGARHLVEGKDYAELLTLLQRGLVETVIGPDAVMRSFKARPGETDNLRITVLDQGYELYAAAGAAMPDDQVHKLRAAYQQLVDSGAVAQLKKRHPDVFPSG